MTIDRKKFEWNLNTIIQVVTLAVMVGGWVYYWANTVRDIEDVKKWQVNHDQVTSERLIDNRTFRGATEERFKVGERAQAESDRVQDQLAYRLTVVEATLTTQAEQQQKLTEVLSDIQGDLKVIKSFVDQQNAANKRPSP